MAKLYNRDCTLCPCHENDGVTCISGAGNTKNPAILVVGDAPGYQEAMQGKPFGDQQGTLVSEALQEVGIETGRDGDVYATYVCKCYPAGKTRIKNARTCSEEYLLREIMKFKPDLILTLGKTPQTVLLSNTAPISKTHGKIFEAKFELEDEVFETKVMPVEHPFSVLQSPAKLDPWLSDLRRAKSVFYGEGNPYWSDDKLSRFDFQVIESARHFKEVARYLIDNYKGSLLGLDIEASGLDDVMQRDDFKVYCVQFGIIDLEDRAMNESLPVYVLPIQSEHFPVCASDTWADKCRGLLYHFFNERYFKLVGHNLKYDLKGLRRLGVPATGYWDTMMLWANSHGEAPMSLKEIAYQVSDLGGYEKKMDEYFKEHETYDAPAEILVDYGALDVVVTRLLMYEMNQGILQENKNEQ